MQKRRHNFIINWYQSCKDSRKHHERPIKEGILKDDNNKIPNWSNILHALNFNYIIWVLNHLDADLSKTNNMVDSTVVLVKYFGKVSFNYCSLSCNFVVHNRSCNFVVYFLAHASTNLFYSYNCYSKEEGFDAYWNHVYLVGCYLFLMMTFLVVRFWFQWSLF